MNFFIFIFVLFAGTAAAAASYYALHQNQQKSYFDGLKPVEIDHPIFDRMTVIRAEKWEDLAFVVVDDSPTAIAVDVQEIEGKKVIHITRNENLWLVLVLMGETPLRGTINDEECFFVYYEAFQEAFQI